MERKIPAGTLIRWTSTMLMVVHLYDHFIVPGYSAACDN